MQPPLQYLGAKLGCAAPVWWMYLTKVKYIHQTGAAKPGCTMLQWGTRFLTSLSACLKLLERGFNDSRRLIQEIFMEISLTSKRSP